MSEQHPVSHKKPPTGEVTLVFTDVQGSTVLWEKCPDAMRGALHAHNELLRSLAAEWGGYEVKTEGDAFMLAFSDPLIGLRWAQACQVQLLRVEWPSELLRIPDAAELAAPDGTLLFKGLRVRIGVHWGPAEAQSDPTTGRTDYFGPVVNRAARVAGSAHGGQILVSGSAWQRIESHLQGVDGPHVVYLGEHRLKGLERTESLYQVLPAVLSGRRFAPPKTLDPRKTNLPARPSQFVGRAQDLKEMFGLVQMGTRLLTIAGLGGIGKTRLATQYAALHLEAFADEGGAWFCDLTGATDQQSFCSIIAQVLDISPAERSTAQEWIRQVGHALEARGKLLLLLDKFEHLVKPCASIVSLWASLATKAHFLVTSSERLRIDGESVYQLGPLPTPQDADTLIEDSDAVKLFLERARSARPSFRPAGTEIESIGEIVRRLEGLPLAIELAAARITTLSPADMLKRIGQRFDFLGSSTRDAGSSKASLRYAIDWSWQLLEPWEKSALEQCTVFRGGFQLDAAEAIVDLSAFPAAPRILDVVEALVDKSLLRSYETGGPFSEFRFGMFESIRRYAEEQLSHSAERDEMRNRHAAYYLRFGAELLDAIDLDAGGVAMKRLEVEHQNIQAVFDDALGAEPATAHSAAIAIRALTSLEPYYLNRSSFPEHAHILQRVLAHIRGLSVEPELLARLEFALARAKRYMGLMDEALQGIQDIEARVSADSPVLAWAEGLKADILVEQGRYEAVGTLCMPYVSGMKTSGRDPMFVLRHAQAKAHFYRGRMDDAIELSKQNVTDSQCSGRPARHALALNMLGAAYLKQGNIAEATPLFHSSSALSQEIGDLRTMALACVNLGICYHTNGDIEASIKHHEKAAAMFRRISDRANEVRLLFNLGQIRRESGNFEAAEDVLANAARLAQELNMTHMLAKIRLERSECFRARSLFDRAADECSEAEKLFRDLNIPAEILAARLKRIEIMIDGGEPGARASALSELAECEKHPSVQESPVLEIKVLYLKGRLTSGFKPAEARKYLEQAMTKLEAMPAPDPELKQRISDAFRHADDPGVSEGAPVPTQEKDSDPAERPRTAVKMEEPEMPAERPTPEYPATVVAATPTPADAPRPVAPFRRRSDIESLSLLEVVRKINSPLDVQDVLMEIVDSLVGFMDAERGFLLLAEEDKLAVRVARSKEKKDIRDPAESFSLSIAQESLDQGKPIITLDATKDPRFKEAASVGQLQLKSAVSVPLFMKGEALGAIYLDTRLKTGRFTEQDVPMLSALAELAALAIFRAQLIAQNVRDQRELRRSLKEIKDTKQEIEQLNAELENSNRKLQETVQHQEEELTSAQRRLQDLVHDEQPKYKYERIVGNSPGMRQVLLQLDRAVEMRVPVLLVGKSGTGKELMARAIHYNSPSKDQPFVAVNCTAIPQELVESELFGHVRGAFTGADRDKPGLFETAEGGTLFLDEIGDIPLPLQAKLLRVLQESTVRRVGGNTEKKVDVRVIAATNVDLKELVAQKKFREDLYYRLRVFRISIPPLRERREDVQGLTEYFLKEIARQYRVPAKTILKSALRLLVGYEWPGNVRELENTLRSAFVLSKGKEIQVEDLRQMEELFGGSGPAPVREGLGLREALLQVQKQMIEDALRRHDGSVTEAAKELRVDRSQLSHWIRKLKLTPSRPEEGR